MQQSEFSCSQWLTPFSKCFSNVNLEHGYLVLCCWCIESRYINFERLNLHPPANQSFDLLAQGNSCSTTNEPTIALGWCENIRSYFTLFARRYHCPAFSIFSKFRFLCRCASRYCLGLSARALVWRWTRIWAFKINASTSKVPVSKAKVSLWRWIIEESLRIISYWLKLNSQRWTQPNLCTFLGHSAYRAVSFSYARKFR